ncbi:unnamed protein product [[Candida] boidinii]|uniref:Unnamed protein product n=1 Tax=Candida boidinii TaxID=5477 RepID=A0ACB5TWZ9_CANBO|nr:unnamed protein product [[Candida] boidinii]
MAVVEAFVVGIVVDSYSEEFDIDIAVEEEEEAEVFDDDDDDVVDEASVVEASVVEGIAEEAFVVYNNHYYIEDYDLGIDLNVDTVLDLKVVAAAVVAVAVVVVEEL